MKYYLIGIKGTGMTALAEVLKAKGHDVLGSDTTEKFFTDDILNRLKIKVFEGFAKKNVPTDCDVVVKSAAYGPTNPEVEQAKNLRLKIIDYPEALGEISKSHHSISICGTHGKTTQSAMLSVILDAIGLDPLCIVGSAVPEFGNKNARIQNNDNKLFIAETCEYKRNFLYFEPDKILIPSLDFDHGDYFKDREDYINAFVEYASKLPKNADIVYCHDSVAIEFVKKIKKIRPDLILTSYGQSPNCDYVLTEIENLNSKNIGYCQKFNAKITLSVPGKHNLLNALGTLIMAEKVYKKFSRDNFPLALGLKSLEKFSGTKRRFEKIGEINGALIFDDYAHHPLEIEKTLEAAKDFFPGKNLIAIFQSHTFSRTQKLENDFAKSFDNADLVILGPIYSSAREKEKDYSSKQFFEGVKKIQKNVLYFEKFQEITETIKDNATPNDIIITMGAGDIWKVAAPFKKL